MRCKFNQLFTIFPLYRYELTSPYFKVGNSPGIKKIVNSEAFTEKKESKPIQKNTSAIKKAKENVVPKKPIVLSEEDKIKKEVRIQSMSVPGLAAGYYLVTNVFSVPGNATKWSQFLTEKNYNAQTFTNSRNNWKYVYVASNNDLIPVYEKWKAYEDFEYFKEIWIMKINL